MKNCESDADVELALDQGRRRTAGSCHAWPSRLYTPEPSTVLHSTSTASTTEEPIASTTEELCLICVDMPKQVRVQCGHLFACGVCIRKLTSCAICRAEITAVYQVADTGRPGSDSPGSSEEVEASSGSNAGLCRRYDCTADAVQWFVCSDCNDAIGRFGFCDDCIRTHGLMCPRCEKDCTLSPTSPHSQSSCASETCEICGAQASQSFSSFLCSLTETPATATPILCETCAQTQKPQCQACGRPAVVCGGGLATPPQSFLGTAVASTASEDQPALAADKNQTLAVSRLLSLPRTVIGSNPARRYVSSDLVSSRASGSPAAAAASTSTNLPSGALKPAGFTLQANSFALHRPQVYSGEGVAPYPALADRVGQPSVCGLQTAEDQFDSSRTMPAADVPPALMDNLGISKDADAQCDDDVKSGQAMGSDESLAENGGSAESLDFRTDPTLMVLADHCLGQNSILQVDEEVRKCDIGTTKLAWMALLVSEQWQKSRPDLAEKVLFIASTVPLVRQHHEVATNSFSHMTPGIIIGDATVDTWQRPEWQEALCKHGIIITTPQLLLDALDAEYLNMYCFSCVVVIECQHCAGRHPLARIFKDHYWGQCCFGYHSLDRVRVLGLARRLVKPNQTDPTRVRQKLEALMNSKIINWHADILSKCSEQAVPIMQFGAPPPAQPPPAALCTPPSTTPSQPQPVPISEISALSDHDDEEDAFLEQWSAEDSLTENLIN